MTPVRQAPEEGLRIYRPKRCGNNYEDNRPKTLNDKNQLPSFFFINACAIQIYRFDWGYIFKLIFWNGMFFTGIKRVQMDGKWVKYHEKVVNLKTSHHREWDSPFLYR